jgi:speckle-type POZ protein
LTKPFQEVEDLDDGAQFHVEVVIKFHHEQRLTEQKSSSLILDLAKLFEDKKLTDVNIVCNDETFNCHKAILAARSEVFSSMFEMSGSTKNKTGEVKVEDIDAKTMKTLLDYIYQNKFPKPDADMMDLLFAADKYYLAELVSHCQETILKNITDETVLDIAVSSRQLTSQEVFEAAKKFIETRPIKSLKAGNAWKKFKKENPKEAKEITQKPTKKKQTKK